MQKKKQQQQNGKSSFYAHSFYFVSRFRVRFIFNVFFFVCSLRSNLSFKIPFRKSIISHDRGRVRIQMLKNTDPVINVTIDKISRHL